MLLCTYRLFLCVLYLCINRQWVHRFKSNRSDWKCLKMLCQQGSFAIGNHVCLSYSWLTWQFISNDFTLHWHLNDHDGVSNHQPHDCLLNRLFRRRSKKIPKLRVTGLCAGNSPAQGASYTENVSIWWRHHESCIKYVIDDWLVVWVFLLQ